MTDKISKRLLSVCDFVKKGSVVADIGTDHAYIPLELVLSGKCETVYACDINKGPLESAERTIKNHFLEDKIKTILADGTKGITDKNCDTIIIAGMGGELIAKIIDQAADYLKHKANFILQPMTQQPLLRKWLWNNGFTVTDENLCFDDERIYQIILSEYTGEITEYNDIDCIIGKINPLRNANKKEFLMHLKRNIEIYENIKNGKSLAGQNTEREESIIVSLTDLLKNSEK